MPILMNMTIMQGAEDDEKEIINEVSELLSAFQVEFTRTVTDKQVSPTETSRQKNRCFRLVGVSAELWCEDPPWESGKGGTSVIPEFVEQRIVVAEDSPTLQDRNRMNVWGMVKLAESGTVAEEVLFKSSGSGHRFTLRPPFRSAVPLQWIHVGPYAIVDALADIPCGSMSSDKLLHELNYVLGTDYTPDKPGLAHCLRHVTSISQDFGQAYGILRPWWSCDLSQAVQGMTQREAEFTDLRRQLINRTSLSTSKIPPRRVWDLYSNRILPFHFLRTSASPSLEEFPPNLWLVTHSWVADEERYSIWTAINGRQSPIPIPRKTTLEHIRIELLNLGAEYVWLDVLCLRLAGGVDENLRQEEWTLDIPTIGHLFRSNPRPCITYFNGLGLPFDTSVNTLQSPYHWLNRTWAIQECTDTWLPGGLASDCDLPTAVSIYARVKRLLIGLRRPRGQAYLIDDLVNRFYLNGLDQVAALAYIFGCLSLPRFDSTTSPQAAWILLIKHMPSAARTSVFLQYETDIPFGLYVSWKRYLESEPTLLDTCLFAEECLELDGPLQTHAANPGRYYQRGHVIGPCHILLDPCDPCSGDVQDIQLHFTGRSPVAIKISGMHGVILPSVPYHLLGIGQKWKERWVVTEVVGERRTKGQPMLEGVKWGVLSTDEVEGAFLQALESGRPGTGVVYIDAKQAHRRSRHSNGYMKVSRCKTVDACNI